MLSYHQKNTGIWKSRLETGTVLILIISILAVISLIAVHLAIQARLYYRMADSLSHKIAQSLKQEIALSQFETALEQNPKKRSLPEYHQFIPDELEYECKRGVDIFKTQVGPLQSYFAIRYFEQT